MLISGPTHSQLSAQDITSDLQTGSRLTAYLQDVNTFVNLVQSTGNSQDSYIMVPQMQSLIANLTVNGQNLPVPSDQIAALMNAVGPMVQTLESQLTLSCDNGSGAWRPMWFATNFDDGGQDNSFQDDHAAQNWGSDNGHWRIYSIAPLSLATIGQPTLVGIDQYVIAQNYPGWISYAGVRANVGADAMTTVSNFMASYGTILNNYS